MKIAKMMKVNRHTVTCDIEFGYKTIEAEWDRDLINIILRQIYRLEIQRNRLLKQLNRGNTFPESLMLEKMIFEIDSKIAEIATKGSNSRENLLKMISKVLDNLNKGDNQRQYWIGTHGFFKVSKKTEDKIHELIREDLRNPEYLEEYIEAA